MSGPDDSLSPQVAPVGDPAPEPVCPYPGSAAFDTDDARWFFGRTDLVDQLVARLRDRTTLVVAGPLKCGKSSLVKAGLLPALALGSLPGSGEWRQSVFTPGTHPLDTLWAALGRIAREPLPDIFSLDEAPSSAVDRYLEDGVLVVDQFEEAFTACSDKAELGAFLSVLETLGSSDRPGFKLVLCMGSDLYGACSAVPWLAEAISENHVLVGPPSAGELHQMIEFPARRAGLRLEEGLADRILADAGDGPFALPLVAQALRHTWDRRTGRVLTIKGYDKVEPAAAPPMAPQPADSAARPTGAEPKDPELRGRSGFPIMAALVVLALLASAALGILLTQVAH